MILQVLAQFFETEVSFVHGLFVVVLKPEVSLMHIRREKHYGVKSVVTEP